MQGSIGISDVDQVEHLVLAWCVKVVSISTRARPMPYFGLLTVVRKLGRVLQISCGEGLIHPAACLSRSTSKRGRIL